MVVLNEVDFDAPWSHGIDQAQVIARAAGYPYVVEVPNLDVRVGPVLYRFGNALLSRYPLVDASVVDLPAFSLLETFLAGKKRGLAVTVETPDGPVRLVGVHLSHRSEAVRVASARHLIALARGCPLPVIIAGDMNSTPSTFPRAQLDDADRNAMDVLRATGRWRRRPLATPRANELTFHSARPTRVIDWILVPRPWTVEAYEVLDTDLSDHLPVVANVGMERPSTR